MKNPIKQSTETDKITLYGIIIVVLSVSAAFMRFTIASRGLLLLTTLVSIPFLALSIFTRRELRISRIQGLFILLLIWCAFSIWSYRGLNLNNIRIQIAGLLFFLYLLNPREEKLLIAVLYIVAAYFIFAYFNQFVYWGGGIRRYIELQPGVFLDPNIVGGSFIIPSAYSVYYLLEKKPLAGKIGVVVFEFLAVVVTMLGGSRGALLSMFVAGIGVFLLKTKNRRKTPLIVAFLIVLLIVLVPLVQGIVPENVMARFTASSLEESGGSGRIELVERAINYISEDSSVIDLFFGYGLDTAKEILGKGIHNTAIDFVWGLGIFGFAFYIYVHIKLILFCLRSKSSVAIGSLFAVLLWSMTLSLSNEIMYLVNIYCCIVFANNQT